SFPSSFRATSIEPMHDSLALGSATRGDAPADRNAAARPNPAVVPSAPDGAPFVPLVSPLGGIDVFA
uniref:hypothetical protein n=1 Tax=Microbacterium sp. K33 TaxID=2305441 RepID=UPI00197B810A